MGILTNPKVTSVKGTVVASMRVLGWGQRANDTEFVSFYLSRADWLRNTAFLLCRDWHLAEDLTQVAFTKLYRVWHRLDGHEALDQYARKVLLRAFLDERRRPWRRETSVEPGSFELDTATAGGLDAVEASALHHALMGLPKRRRAVIVLRYWADMSVEQVAEVLGCSTGTVKSQSARGIAQLREELGSARVAVHCGEGGNNG
ncbi:SigE family RNA polymerase sigma factor [Catellatospora methionotrophica]|uniref:SigE family RNA polymerase sigma factor n=1 Tax=Catellatospora methionotrophica TaxID=121620 RepID=UPI0033ECECD6